MWIVFFLVPKLVVFIVNASLNEPSNDKFNMHSRINIE